MVLCIGFVAVGAFYNDIAIFLKDKSAVFIYIGRRANALRVDVGGVYEKRENGEEACFKLWGRDMKHMINFKMNEIKSKENEI